MQLKLRGNGGQMGSRAGTAAIDEHLLCQVDLQQCVSTKAFRMGERNDAPIQAAVGALDAATTRAALEGSQVRHFRYLFGRLQIGPKLPKQAFSTASGRTAFSRSSRHSLISK